jgi:hypothetical protein
MKTEIQKLSRQLAILGAFLALGLVSSNARAEDDNYKSASAANQVVEGAIIKTKESKNEIYVRSNQGKRVEIYLDKAVKIQKDGAAVKFSELKKDTKVRVTGKTLVEIL